MITKFKLYEKDSLLLCIKETDVDYYLKFTKGKKYKIYNSTIGIRIKDDNGTFGRIDHWKEEKIGDIISYEYADGIFTTANSIKEYEIRKDMNKYNL